MAILLSHTIDLHKTTSVQGLNSTLELLTQLTPLLKEFLMTWTPLCTILIMRLLVMAEPPSYPEIPMWINLGLVREMDYHTVISNM